MIKAAPGSERLNDLGLAAVAAPIDPNLAALVRRLPIMKNGKPRKFRLYCECFEWTFNQLYNFHVLSFASPANKVQRVENFAKALWHHQNPRVMA